MTGKALFISGTDTDVGKSVISLVLCVWAHVNKLRAAYYKPIQCGTEGRPVHRLPNGDAGWICSYLPFEQFVSQTFVYSNPVSPHLAAEKENKSVSIRTIQSELKKLCSGFELVIVEGAGGVAVPINRSGGDMAALAAALDIPVLIATHGGLGTLNHSILTREYLRQKKCAIAGFCFNRRGGEVSELESDNQRTIIQRTGMRFWGTCPYIPELREEKKLSADRMAVLSEALGTTMSKWFFQKENQA